MELGWVCAVTVNKQKRCEFGWSTATEAFRVKEKFSELDFQGSEVRLWCHAEFITLPYFADYFFYKNSKHIKLLYKICKFIYLIKVIEFFCFVFWKKRTWATLVLILGYFLIIILV